MTGRGTLYGVGTGPGDPELMTVKAIRAIENADVIVHFAKRGRAGRARRTAEQWIGPGATELALHYPVTTELDHRSDAYRAQIAEFFDHSAALIRDHLDAARSVAILSGGDPLFYGSYMHLHIRLANEFPSVVIPGITAMSGCWSLAGLAMAQGEDALTVLPGTMEERELSRRLRDSDAAVIMKIGRNLAKIRRALEASGRLDRAIYVERGTMAEGFQMPLANKQDDEAPYFSLLLIPGWRVKP